MSDDPRVSVVIVTYRRERVLVETIDHVLGLTPPADEIVVVDQTEQHELFTADWLAEAARAGKITWVRLPRPSIPRAMNRGLAEARHSVVLFLDDDVIPSPGLIAAHAAAYRDPKVVAVAGRIIQPNTDQSQGRTETVSLGLERDLSFRFHGTESRVVFNCMAGNLSVRRDRAIAVGGFDENFQGIAYRFETEFCRRLVRRTGLQCLFEPKAQIHHLQAQSGGTRATYADPARCSPNHSVGDYYFAFVEGTASERLIYGCRRLYRGICNRYFLRHPWRIPERLFGELQGYLWARRLARGGPFLFDASRRSLSGVTEQG